MNKEKLLDYFSWTLLIIGIILFRFFQHYPDNVVNAKSFYWQYGLSSFFISVFFLYLIYVKFPIYFKNGEENRGSAVLSFVFGWTIFLFFGFTFYNYETSKENSVVKTYKIVRQSKNVRYKTKYVYLKVGDNIEKFNITKFKINKKITSDSIQIRLGKGKLDYEVILKFL